MTQVQGSMIIQSKVMRRISIIPTYLAIIDIEGTHTLGQDMVPPVGTSNANLITTGGVRENSDGTIFKKSTVPINNLSL